MAGWTARALGRLTDVPAPTVIAWIAAGLITPERYGRGRGGHTIGIAGLMELLAIVELRSADFSLQAIRRAVENLRDLSGHERPLARLTLVVVGKDIVWTDADELADMPISALRRPGQRLMVFPIGERHAELIHQLETYEASGNLSPKP